MRETLSWAARGAVVAAVATAAAAAGGTSGHAGASVVLAEIATPRMETASFSLHLLAEYQGNLFTGA
jgi:hypothetical protein